MLIDDFLPGHDFEEMHSIEIDADAATIYEAALEYEF